MPGQRFDYSGERQRHEQLVGRAELLARLDQLLVVGHTNEVWACAVTPDNRHVVSASEGKTLKVWDLETYACLMTHRGDAYYYAVAATTTVIIAGDSVGSVWFLDMPPSRPLVMPVNTDPVRVDLEGRWRSSQQARETLMTRNDLLTRLSQLLPSQFEEVLFRAGIPTPHLSGTSAPQATRAIDVIRYLEQQNQLEQLAPASPDSRSGRHGPSITHLHRRRRCARAMTRSAREPHFTRLPSKSTFAWVSKKASLCFLMTLLCSDAEILQERNRTRALVADAANVNRLRARFEGDHRSITEYACSGSEVRLAATLS